MSSLKEMSPSTLTQNSLVNWPLLYKDDLFEECAGIIDRKLVYSYFFCSFKFSSIQPISLAHFDAISFSPKTTKLAKNYFLCGNKPQEEKFSVNLSR